MSSLIKLISGWVEENQNDCLLFLKQIIEIPSPSGEEKEVAEFLSSKMGEYGFTSSKVDSLGDAMGVIKGEGGGLSLLVNGHIDHVPVGDMVEPYSGKIVDGSKFGDEGDVIYGRAASDMKGAVSAMILAGKALNDLGIRLKGDYKVAAVAQEETGGACTKYTIVDSQF